MKRLFLILVIVFLFSGCFGNAGAIKDVSGPENIGEGVNGVKIKIENKQPNQAVFTIRAHGEDVQHLSYGSMNLLDLFAVGFTASAYLVDEQYADLLLGSGKADGSLEIDIVLPPNGENVFPVLFKKTSEGETSYVVELVYDNKVIDTKTLKV